MIKKVELKNIFGIKEQSINLEVKYEKSGQQENQLIEHRGNHYALTPLFLAKNASGKTSILKALDFALRFTNIQSITREISLYFSKCFSLINEAQIMHEINRDSIAPQRGSFKSNPSQIKEAVLGVINGIFVEKAFSGSDLASIEIKLINNQTIYLEMSPTFFNVWINKQKIDIAQLMQVFNYDLILTKTTKDLHEELKTFIENRLKKVQFLSQKHASIFDEYFSNQEMNMSKNKVQTYIDAINDHFGFDFVKMLIQKIDSNVSAISFNPNNKSIEITMKNAYNNMPISASMLSFGTIRTLEIIAKSIPLFNLGGVMIIDEIEHGLHLSLIRLIASTFSNPNINFGRAQLFLTTHNSLIVENGIISHKNVFMQDNGCFVNIRCLEGKVRTEDVIAFAKNKNYHNEIFWEKRGVSAKTTLSLNAITQLIDSMLKKKSVAIVD